MKITSLINWKLFALLLGAGVLGTVAVFPFILTTQGEALHELPLSLPLVLILSLVQTTVLLGITVFLGVLLSKQVGLSAPILENWLKKLPVTKQLYSVGILGVKLGALVGMLIIGLDYLFAQFTSPLIATHTPLWQGLLASLYGGITEELLMRLFLVSLFVWIMWRCTQAQNTTPRALYVWIAIVASAIIFGLGHLPATALIVSISPLIVLRALVLNGIGGVVFGWLYWKHGLEAAMIAHFTTDIILLVVFPLFFLS